MARISRCVSGGYPVEQLTSGNLLVTILTSVSVKAAGTLLMAWMLGENSLPIGTGMSRLVMLLTWVVVVGLPSSCDIRRPLTKARRFRFPIVTELQKDMTAVSGVVNQDGWGGAAPDPTLWCHGARAKNHRDFRVFVSVVSSADLALSPYAAGLRCKCFSFSGSFQWPSPLEDISMGCPILNFSILPSVHPNLEWVFIRFFGRCWMSVGFKLGIQREQIQSCLRALYPFRFCSAPLGHRLPTKPVQCGTRRESDDRAPVQDQFHLPGASHDEGSARIWFRLTWRTRAVSKKVRAPTLK